MRLTHILLHPPARILLHPPASSYILLHPPKSSRPHPPSSSRILPLPPTSFYEPRPWCCLCPQTHLSDMAPPCSAVAFLLSSEECNTSGGLMLSTIRSKKEEVWYKCKDRSVRFLSLQTTVRPYAAQVRRYSGSISVITNAGWKKNGAADDPCSLSREETLS